MRESDRRLMIDKINARIDRLKIILNTGDIIEQKNNKEMEKDESVRLDNLSQQSVDANLYILAEQELSQLMANLNWLDGDDAGNCEECGCEIPIKRLLAVPETRRCINCASDF